MSTSIINPAAATTAAPAATATAATTTAAATATAAAATAPAAAAPAAAPAPAAKKVDLDTMRTYEPHAVLHDAIFVAERRHATPVSDVYAHAAFVDALAPRDPPQQNSHTTWDLTATSDHRARHFTLRTTKQLSPVRAARTINDAANKRRDGIPLTTFNVLSPDYTDRLNGMNSRGNPGGSMIGHLPVADTFENEQMKQMYLNKQLGDIILWVMGQDRVVLLQEVCDDLFNMLTKAVVKQPSLRMVRTHLHPQRKMCNVTLWNAEVYHQCGVAHGDDTVLPYIAKVDHPTDKSKNVKEQYELKCVKLRTKHADAEDGDFDFVVVNVHVPFGKQAVATYTAAFQALKKRFAGMPIVIGGDWNATARTYPAECKSASAAQTDYAPLNAHVVMPDVRVEQPWSHLNSVNNTMGPANQRDMFDYFLILCDAAARATVALHIVDKNALFKEGSIARFNAHPRGEGPLSNPE